MGKRLDFSYIAGTQYNAILGASNLIFGMENQGAWLKDNKLGYPDYGNAVIVDGSIVNIPHTDNVVIADQSTNTFGVFSQYEINWEKMKITAGARFDIYKVEDKGYNSTEKTGNVLSPRINILYNIKKYLQARVSYSQGYRAPQIFDEVLHIETSGSRQVIHTKRS